MVLIHLDCQHGAGKTTLLATFWGLQGEWIDEGVSQDLLLDEILCSPSTPRKLNDAQKSTNEKLDVN